MTSNKSSWWSITAFNEEAKLLVASQQGNVAFPDFVKELYGGMEKCPSTGKEHFQGALHTSHVRMSQVKKWLPTAHLEVARNKEALKKYAMKEETATDCKQAVTNFAYQPLGQLIKELVIFRYEHMTKDRPSEIKAKDDYLKVVRYYGRVYPDKFEAKTGVLTDPKTSRAYVMTAMTYYENLIDELEEKEREG